VEEVDMYGEMEWPKLVAELGALVVGAGLLFYAVFMSIKTVNKWVNKKIDQQPANVMGYDHGESVGIILKITPEIKAVLKELLLQTHCSRAYIFSFHNGQEGFGGLPFVYMSNTYEVLSGKADSQHHARQNMSFTMYDTFIKQLLEKDVLVMSPDNRTDEYDDMVYETLVKRGIKLTIRTKLNDEHGRIIGYLGIDFCKGDMMLFKDEAIPRLEKIVYKEAQILSTLLYVKVEGRGNAKLNKKGEQ